MHPSTAILLFARTAFAEGRVKHFTADPGRNEQALALLNAHALRVTRATGFPVFHLNERQQRGADFGARITNATADIFARGFDRLIIVGSDCPTLSTYHLRRAERTLRTGTSVIGPDHRGGAYLIGLHRRDFDAGEFERLPWQTDRLLDALRNHLSRVILLVPQRDLNDRSDLLNAFVGRPGNRVIALLRSLLWADQSSISADLSAHRLTLVRRVRTDRGPPQYLLLLRA